MFYAFEPAGVAAQENFAEKTVNAAYRFGVDVAAPFRNGERFVRPMRRVVNW